MTLDVVELFRAACRFRRAISNQSTRRWVGPFVGTGSWLLRRSGMRSHAPKRNVILALIYLYAVLVLVSVGSV
ncbi:hypothetical protein DU504_03005 [Haloplanus salinus]|jgi:hypothetical protein|uniref:Uncharacterized protein n=1 Tax=Haloplanus salinus TaxID=1126245 RepID=A0A368N705_9EURY|nr:hypothetical protein [Haloplanus salinus]RCU46367.1 hypothetical protein DU504_03005 [Haloplanus salinus]